MASGLVLCAEVLCDYRYRLLRCYRRCLLRVADPMIPYDVVATVVDRCIDLGWVPRGTGLLGDGGLVEFITGTAFTSEYWCEPIEHWRDSLIREELAQYAVSTPEHLAMLFDTAIPRNDRLQRVIWGVP